MTIIARIASSGVIGSLKDWLIAILQHAVAIISIIFLYQNGRSLLSNNSYLSLTMHAVEAFNLECHTAT